MSPSSVAMPLVLSLVLAQTPPPPVAEKPRETQGSSFAGLKMRLLGPALTSGRVVGLAVHPRDRSVYYVAVASGGVWKTTNAGTSWTPLFDDQGSYSIGYVTLDPSNPETIWVGTGENNSQRSVGYGDGVYRSDDGGKTWQNMGLKTSEHIGKILIHPRDSRIIYVAAQGPLWGPGGERGLYKSVDGGKSWKQVLSISENTGVTDVVLDPRNPEVLLAASYQRRRHVWTLIDGGPESALYKSTDGGTSWRKLKTGLPTGELGRIGLAVAPTDPDTVYAIIESIEKKGGIFRSTDFGENWEKRNDFDQQAQYYSHLVVDPRNKDRLYVMNVFIRLSEDGGKTLQRLGEKWKHVDNHCMWIDPKHPNYYLVGCDGGIYESFDRGANWKFVANLPVTQFYDVTCDQSGPFYHVYGGTQDNFTLGGPARTRSVHGITNQDWFVVQDGDGFHVKVDPKNPNIVYAEAQYGVLVRYDRRNGQRVSIQPLPGKGEPPLRWNWDSPLLISPHSSTRIYFAANRLFRSDDRGESWKAISGDLTRQLDRNSLAVMGKVWSMDAVAKNLSTSFYGNITALAESPLKEGLLYVGTDDGLIQVSETGGGQWRKIERFPGVPERTYVARLFASQHDADTIYAAFDNHKMSDYAPYLLKSKDRGKTWTSIASNLPSRGTVLAFAEDHKEAELLFAGTEFGLYFTRNGGKEWHRLKGGFPTIAVRDLAIQKTENDLVVGTFGRSIYVLDDYTPLRTLKDDTLTRPQVLFPVRTAWMYIPTRQYGGRGKAFLGEAFYTANNPPLGATFTYHLKDTLKTRKEKRREAEAKASKEGKPLPKVTPAELRAEAEEEAPTMVLTIKDSTGAVVRRLPGPVSKGFHRVTWNLRHPAPVLAPPRTTGGEEDLFVEAASGPLVMPGTYTVSLAQRVDGVVTELGQSQSFQVQLEGTNKLPEAELKELFAFQEKVTRLERAVAGTLQSAQDLATRLDRVKEALDRTPTIDEKTRTAIRGLIQRNRDILRALRGDTILRARNENVSLSIVDRVEYLVDAQRMALAKPTQTQRDAYREAAEAFGEQLTKLRTLIDSDLKMLEKSLEDAGGPWTPGRLPEWKDR